MKLNLPLYTGVCMNICIKYSETIIWGHKKCHENFVLFFIEADLLFRCRM